eukprot:366403-Chlamydomonas_euryale.AAC.6
MDWTCIGWCCRPHPVQSAANGIATTRSGGPDHPIRAALPEGPPGGPSSNGIGLLFPHMCGTTPISPHLHAHTLNSHL